MKEESEHSLILKTVIAVLTYLDNNWRTAPQLREDLSATLETLTFGRTSSLEDVLEAQVELGHLMQDLQARMCLTPTGKKYLEELRVELDATRHGMGWEFEGHDYRDVLLVLKENASALTVTSRHSIGMTSIAMALLAGIKGLPVVTMLDGWSWVVMPGDHPMQLCRRWWAHCDSGAHHHG